MPNKPTKAHPLGRPLALAQGYLLVPARKGGVNGGLAVTDAALL